ncbi:hypothetical protein AAVH_20764 [Aphelenchoides avenae]|nr:hypothetical protein AAVH_20764 [Aphelenchus avenae]
MRQYRPYLALISVWDFVFTAMLLLLVMDVLYPASCIVANGPIGLAGRNASLTAFFIAGFAAINGLWTQDLCLLYRFLVVQRNEKLAKSSSTGRVSSPLSW